MNKHSTMNSSCNETEDEMITALLREIEQLTSQARQDNDGTETSDEQPHYTLEPRVGEGYLWISNPLNMGAFDGFQERQCACGESSEMDSTSEWSSSTSEDVVDESESSEDCDNSIPEAPPPPPCYGAVDDSSSDDFTSDDMSSGDEWRIYEHYKGQLSHCDVYIQRCEDEKKQLEGEVHELESWRSELMGQIQQLNDRKLNMLREKSLIPEMIAEIDEYSMAVAMILECGEFDKAEDMILYYARLNNCHDLERLKKHIIDDARSEKLNELVTAVGYNREALFPRRRPAPRLYDQDLSDSFFVDPPEKI